METREHLVELKRTESERDIARRRLGALAAAIREHEGRMRAQILGPRPHDAVLYRRLRQIGGER
jgi:hypothetical protein